MVEAVFDIRFILKLLELQKQIVNDDLESIEYIK